MQRYAAQSPSLYITSVMDYHFHSMQTLSKITSQGQVSVPAVVRQALGVGPGGMLEWVEENGRISVQRPTRHSTKEVHEALFPRGSAIAPKTPGELKQGVRELMLRRHARR